MRIRKLLKSNPELAGDSSGNATVQPHHCKFNQDPWDVEHLSSLPSFPDQLEGDDGFIEKRGLEEFSGALQSVASSLRIYTEDDKAEEEEEEEKEVIYCAKTDDNGNFICGLEAKQGETVCKSHLRGHIAQTKKSNRSGKNAGKKSKFESDSNPYQSLYYYAGFGPSWRKRRGVQENNSNEVVTATSSSRTQLDENVKRCSEDEVVEYEEEDADNYKENGKKRGRKKIKARSLKSLM